MNQLIATCEIVIDGPVDRVWRALITPSAILKRHVEGA